MCVFDPVHNFISNSSVICEAHVLYSECACLAVGQHLAKTPATGQSRTPQNHYNTLCYCEHCNLDCEMADLWAGPSTKKY